MPQRRQREVTRGARGVPKTVRLSRSLYLAWVFFGLVLLSVATAYAAQTPSPASLLREGTSAYQRYYHTLDQLHWRKVMTPSHLATPSGVARGLNIVASVKSAYDKYASTEQHVLSVAKSRERADRRNDVQSHTSATRIVSLAMRTFTSRDLTLEQKKIAAVQHFFDALRDNPGAWQVRGDRLTFQGGPGSAFSRTVYAALTTVRGAVSASRDNRKRLMHALKGHKAALLQLDPRIFRQL